MNKNEKAKIELQKGIEIAIQKAIDDAPFDKIETGIIKEVTNNGYTVLINKVLYYNIKTIGGSCAVNEVVKIVTPQNQSNNMFILKSSSGGSGGNVNSVNGKVGDVILNANDVGALPISGGVLSEKLQINSTSSDILTVNRNNRDYYALIKFSNQLNGLLGYIGMGGSSNGGLTRWNSDGVTSYTMLDSNNYANIIPIATTSVNGLMNFSDKTFMTKLNQEVGTFTPKFANTNYPNGVPESAYTVDGYCYYTVRNGYYQRIGNVVYVYSTMRGYYRITNLENYQKQAMIVGLPFAMYGDYQTPISIGASSNVFNTYGTTTDCSTNAKATVYNGGLQFWNSNGINSIDLRYSTSMFFLSFAGTYLING